MKHLSIALFVLIASCGVARAEHFTLATLDFPPYEFQEDGKMRGIAVDIVTEAMHRLGHTVDIQLVPWARGLDEARSGNVDGIFTAYKTTEREAFLDYSEETLVSQIVSLFVAEKSPISFDGNLTKLSQMAFAVINQMSYGKIVDGALKDGTLKNVQKTNDIKLSIKMLVAGHVDVVISNKYVALFDIKNMRLEGAVRELTPAVEDVPSYIAFTKARDLHKIRQDIDGALKAMHADGTYDRIVKIYSE